MSWLTGLFSRPASASGETALLRLRTTRFRQLLGSHGALLALIEDSADKQGGGFVFDRQYVIALAEQAAELADAVAFDLNVLTAQGQLAFYDEAERLRAELRALLARSPEAARDRTGDRRPEAAVSSVNPSDLAAALARSEVLCRASGTVACRGIAAGPICNLGDRPERAAVPPGSVLVAVDLGPAEGVLATIRRAGALLLDRGSSAGPAARLARELRVPAILGLGGVASRLATGTEVTVDADENVVYRGRVPELLEYARSTRVGAEEEPEYRLLRAVRRAAFPLTLSTSPPEPALEDCRTLHDLVHLAHALAGDALAELLLRGPGEDGTPVRLVDAPWCEARLVALDGLLRRSTAAIGPLDISSRPLRALLDGIARREEVGEDAGGRLPAAILRAAATDEHALTVIAPAQGARGVDMVEATLVGVSEGNEIYCRFNPRGEGDPGGGRGELAAGVLSRLGFTVAATSRAATGSVRGLSTPEAEERLRILGVLSVHLARLGTRGWSVMDVEASAEAFLRGCA